METTIQFVNEAVAIDPTKDRYYVSSGHYGYNRPSKYLILWGRLFQSIISQGASYLVAGKFHDGHCSIYKCEGGVKVTGAGDVVLSKDGCYLDSGRRDETRDIQQKTIAGLITDVVLSWNPMDPVESMLLAAAEHIFLAAPSEWKSREYTRDQGYQTVILKNELKSVEDVLAALKIAVEKSTNGGVFGGNALSDFFNWNPFSKAPIDREYQRWCLVRYNDMTEEQVDQKFADEDLGEKLLKDVNDAIRKANGGGRGYFSTALCCSPRRSDDGLKFWVNTGTTTQIDGWKTQEQLKAYIASGEILKKVERQ